MLVPILLGGSIGVFAAVGLALNILVMIVIVRGGFLLTDGSAFYTIAFNLLASDTIHLALLIIYLVPASILQSELYPGLGHTVGFLMLSVLLVSYLMIDLLAYSRFVQVCFPQFSWLFNRRNMIKLCIISWPVCGILAAVGQYVLPCCDLVLYYKTYSLHFGGNTTNYSDLFVEKPISVGTTLSAVFCYTVIFFKMRAGRRRVENSMSAREQQTRRRREISFAFQYGTIALCATLTWISFVIYPLIIPLDQPQWFVLVAMGMILNSSISALIYVRFNQDLYCALMIFVFNRTPATSTTMTMAVSSQRSMFQSRIVENTPQTERNVLNISVI